jgi:Protein of unknown function (DUF4238)
MKNKIAGKIAVGATKKRSKPKLKGPGHYVPKFWIKGFAGPGGRLVGRKRVEALAKQVKASEIMADQGAYTVFDSEWQAYDVLEDLLANKHEGGVAELFRSLRDPSAALTSGVRSQLCHAIAVAACRLPHVMRRGFRRINEMALSLAGIPAATSFESFHRQIGENFGVEITQTEFDYFRGLPADQLAAKIEVFVARSPQHHVLPEQDALLGVPNVAAIISGMDLTLVDAPAGSFILGDSPLPDYDLAKGFTLPLWASLALSASPKAADDPLFVRRPATGPEINSINQAQFDNSVEIVVGASRAVLEAF